MMSSGTHHFDDSDWITEPLQNTSGSDRNLRAKDHFKRQTEIWTQNWLTLSPVSDFLIRGKGIAV